MCLWKSKTDQLHRIDFELWDQGRKLHLECESLANGCFVQFRPAIKCLKPAITGTPRSARKVPGPYAGAICAFAASGRTKASMLGPARTKRTLVPQSFREGLIFGCRAEWWRRSGRGTMIGRAQLTDQSTC